MNVEKDRRRFLRVSYSTSAILTDEKGNQVSGNIRNLSLKGAFVEAEDSVDIDSPVKVEINVASLSSSLNLSLMGKIVRKDSRGVGVEFTEMDIDTFVHLKSIVALNHGDLDTIEDEFHKFLQSRLKTSEGLTDG